LKRKINRRNLIIGGGAAVASAVSALSESNAFAGQHPQQEKTHPNQTTEKPKLAPPKNGDEAMARLLAGNERF